jgi:hypothetical protein
MVAFVEVGEIFLLDLCKIVNLKINKIFTYFTYG